MNNKSKFIITARTSSDIQNRFRQKLESTVYTKARYYRTLGLPYEFHLCCALCKQKYVFQAHEVENIPLQDFIFFEHEDCPVLIDIYTGAWCEKKENLV